MVPTGVDHTDDKRCPFGSVTARKHNESIQEQVVVGLGPFYSILHVRATIDVPAIPLAWLIIHEDETNSTAGTSNGAVCCWSLRTHAYRTHKIHVGKDDT